jgi:hypothetical protein
MLLPVAVTTVVFLLCLESISKFKIQIPPSLSISKLTFLLISLSMNQPSWMAQATISGFKLLLHILFHDLISPFDFYVTC